MQSRRARENLLYAVKGIKHREQCTKSNEKAGKGSLRVPSMATNAGIPLSNANCICDLCESLGAKERVKISSAKRYPPKLATYKDMELVHFLESYNDNYSSITHRITVHTPHPISRAVLRTPPAMGIYCLSLSMYCIAPSGNIVPPPGKMKYGPSAFIHP